MGQWQTGETGQTSVCFTRANLFSLFFLLLNYRSLVALTPEWNSSLNYNRQHKTGQHETSCTAVWTERDCGIIPLFFHLRKLKDIFTNYSLFHVYDTYIFLIFTYIIFNQKSFVN